MKVIKMIDDVLFSIEKNNYGLFLSLVKDSNINDKDEFGYSILHIAISTGMNEAAMYYMNNGGDLNSQDANGNTGLHYCAEYNNSIIAKTLANKGARFDIANNSGNEPLWTAVYVSTETEQAILRLFLEYTDRINVKNKYGKSPLDFAKTKGDDSIIKALMSKLSSSSDLFIDNDSKKIETNLKFLSVPLDEDIPKWIWENLIPRCGQADSVQGEIMRAIEKLAWEAQKNGNINWDIGFEKLVTFLKYTLLSEQSFTEKMKTSIAADLDRLENFILPTELKDSEETDQLPCVDDELYDRLIDNLVAFCHQNPTIIPLVKDPDQYR